MQFTTICTECGEMFTFTGSLYCTKLEDPNPQERYLPNDFLPRPKCPRCAEAIRQEEAKLLPDLTRSPLGYYRMMFEKIHGRSPTDWVTESTKEDMVDRIRKKGNGNGKD